MADYLKAALQKLVTLIQILISRGESEKGLSASLLMYTLGPFSLPPLDMENQGH